MLTIHKRVGLAALVTVLVMGAGACLHSDRVARGWQSPRPVRIASTNAVTSLFPSFASYWSAALPGQTQGLLLRDGDQLVLADAMLAYRASDGTDLRFTTSQDNSLLRLNGKVVAVGDLAIRLPALPCGPPSRRG